MFIDQRFRSPLCAATIAALATACFGRGGVLFAPEDQCIDVGDPSSAYRGEPMPNGWRINMGFYGGTAQASKVPPEGTLFLIR